MQKKEAEFQTKFNRWVQNRWLGSAAFELKISKIDSLPFATVVEHQVRALLSVSKGKFVYKIPDLGYQNPFDAVCLTGIPSYIVIQFLKRNQKEFIMIPIEAWMNESQFSERRSLTEKRAKEIGITQLLE